MTPVDPIVVEPVKKTWRPTNKWIASAITGVASVVASWLATGAFDDVERGMTATLVAALVAAYFRSNQDTPGGVPVDKSYGTG